MEFIAFMAGIITASTAYIYMEIHDGKHEKIERRQYPPTSLGAIEESIRERFLSECD